MAPVTETVLRDAQRLSVADQLWLIHRLAQDLSAAAVFAEEPPEVKEPEFVALHHHSVVEFDQLQLSIRDMSALDHGARTILIPGNAEVGPTHSVYQGSRLLPYRVMGCHTDRLLTFADGEDFGETLARFQNNPDFAEVTNPATTIVWLRRTIPDDEPVSREPAAPAGDDEGTQPPQEGDE